MGRLTRWLLLITATLATFVLCLWVARSVTFGWTPRSETDRWAVAAAFAAVMAAAVGAPLIWFAGRDRPGPRPAQRVTQNADASDQASIHQVGGSQGGSRRNNAPAQANQRATAKDRSRVTQIGGDQDAPHA